MTNQITIDSNNKAKCDNDKPTIFTSSTFSIPIENANINEIVKIINNETFSLSEDFSILDKNKNGSKI